MNILIKRSLEDQVPIDIIYMKKDGSICKRTIIVKHRNSHDIKSLLLHQKTDENVSFRFHPLLRACSKKEAISSFCQLI